MSAPRLFSGLLVWLLALLAGSAGAGVFHSRESALAAAFPGAERIQPHDLFLTRPEAERVRELAGARPPSRLVTAYAGWSADTLLGWAFLDTHTVRTLPETLMLVLAPDGGVRSVTLLAFHEPVEYMPTKRWLGRLAGARLGPHLRPGEEIDAISGSTLSVQAIAASVRRLLAVWRVRLAQETG